MTLLICPDGLIGDFLGVLPVAMELSKHDDLHLALNPETEQIFRLLTTKYNIQLSQQTVHYDRVFELDIQTAFDLSNRFNYYMSQSYFACLGLPVPVMPPKAELVIEPAAVPAYD